MRLLELLSVLSDVDADDDRDQKQDEPIRLNLSGPATADESSNAPARSRTGARWMASGGLVIAVAFFALIIRTGIREHGRPLDPSFDLSLLMMAVVGVVLIIYGFVIAVSSRFKAARDDR